MKLSTIQKRENLNVVHAMDEKGPGGAYHTYEVCQDGGDKENLLLEIKMQRGARKDPNHQRGVIDTDLLEIVRHRLQCFQAGEFASEYNAKALAHLEECLMWMNRRVEDRIERNVLGTYKR